MLVTSKDETFKLKLLPEHMGVQIAALVIAIGWQIDRTSTSIEIQDDGYIIVEFAFTEWSPKQSDFTYSLDPPLNALRKIFETPALSKLKQSDINLFAVDKVELGIGNVWITFAHQEKCSRGARKSYDEFESMTAKPKIRTEIISVDFALGVLTARDLDRNVRLSFCLDDEVNDILSDVKQTVYDLQYKGTDSGKQYVDNSSSAATLIALGLALALTLAREFPEELLTVIGSHNFLKDIVDVDNWVTKLASANDDQFEFDFSEASTN